MLLASLLTKTLKSFEYIPASTRSIEFCRVKTKHVINDSYFNTYMRDIFCIRYTVCKRLVHDVPYFDYLSDINFIKR